MMSSATARTTSIGVAYASLLSSSDGAVDVVRPITAPVSSHNAPPSELSVPTASVAIMSCRPTPSALVTFLPSALTTPAVTDGWLLAPAGALTDTAISPTCRSVAEPIVATGTVPASTFTTATSLQRSLPTTVPGSERPSANVTCTAVASFTTCASVTRWPSSRKSTPEPTTVPCGVVTSRRTIAGPIARDTPTNPLAGADTALTELTGTFSVT